MIPWTTQEISLLIGLWPTASAAQISKLLNRSRASICGQAMRLRRDDLLPADVEKHFEVNPSVRTRPDRDKTMETSIRPAKPTPPIDATAPPPDMRRCSLVELADGQCRWPLGDVHQVATLFCGGSAVPGFSYCGYHRRMAVRQRSAAIRPPRQTFSATIPLNDPREFSSARCSVRPTCRP